MARRFALHFDVRVVVEADDADGARAALEQGVEDLAAAHELAEDAEECTEAAAVADALADAPAAPLPVVARALAAVRRERHREARRRAAKAHASPALERAVRGSLRRLVGELFAVLARATLAAAGVSPRRA